MIKVCCVMGRHHLSIGEGISGLAECREFSGDLSVGQTVLVGSSG